MTTIIKESSAYLRPILEMSTVLLLGLVIGGALMAIWGYDPLKAYSALFKGSFGDIFSIANTLSRATPLILTGSTFAIGVRAGLFNIGAQGQMIMGAVAALAFSTLPLPPGLLLIVALGAALLAGAIWSLPASILKVTRGVHEVISTIMLNWIAVWLAIYLIVNLLNDPQRGLRTIKASPGARFPLIFPGSDLTAAIFLSLFFALIIYFILWHMTTGFELRCTGFNPLAARYAGINPARSINLAFILGGMAAGMTGATQVLGRFPYAITNDLSTLGNLGFDGIAVALVGRNHPLGIIGAATFFGALESGAGLMGFKAGVPLDMIRVVQGIIIFAVAVPEVWKLFRRFSFWRRSR